MRLNRRKFLKMTRVDSYLTDFETNWLMLFGPYRAPIHSKARSKRYLVNRIGDSEQKFREAKEDE